jgi:hypothetical protein
MVGEVLVLAVDVPRHPGSSAGQLRVAELEGRVLGVLAQLGGPHRRAGHVDGLGSPQTEGVVADPVAVRVGHRHPGRGHDRFGGTDAEHSHLHADRLPGWSTCLLFDYLHRRNLGKGRFATDRHGYAEMIAYCRQWPQRVWAVEGCNGIDRHVAHRLLADGQDVVDVPPKLSARARVFATGHGRKTDAHSVALVATRMAGLRPVVNDEQLAVLRLLVDRRRSLGEDHTRMISQLHQLLLELIPGGAKKDLSAAQAKALLAKVRPTTLPGRPVDGSPRSSSVTSSASMPGRRRPTKSSRSWSLPPAPR